VDLTSLSLRRRLLFVLTASTGLLVIIALVIGVQYLVSYNGARNLQAKLSPAAELSDNLLLAQSSASGDLSDYVLTGRERALVSYETSIAEANSLIRALEATFDGDPPLLGQLAGVRAAQEVWLNDDATPTLEAMDEGRTAAAARATNKPKAWRSYDSMIAATVDLRDEVEDQRNAARATVSAFGTQLGVWLFILALVVALLVAYSSVSLDQWVIKPLRSIRRDLHRSVRVPHTHPVQTVGPPELQAVAADAENLRRTLVAEIDEATAARDGLMQDAPLVAAMQSLMRSPVQGSVAGCEVAGISATAEGVLSGDWWDAIPLADDRLALVIGDTSGHGTGAVLTALRSRDLLRVALIEGRSPGAAFAFALDAMASDENFVTAFVAVVDSTSHTITYANAGHHPPVVVTIDKDTHVCSGTGPLVSSLGGSWEEQTVPFEPGSLLIAYTDGLVENRAPDGGDLNVDDVSRIVRGFERPVRLDSSEVLSRVVSHIREHAGNWDTDDVTAVVIGHPLMAL